MGYSPCDCKESDTTERIQLGSREYAWVVGEERAGTEQQPAGSGQCFSLLNPTHPPTGSILLNSGAVGIREESFGSFQITSPEITFRDPYAI